jgi:hypothetical protein
MVASVNTFDGCVQILDISKPDWAVLENVPSIENQEEDSRPAIVKVEFSCTGTVLVVVVLLY